jgi:type VI secretion system secreted protein Hcp
MPSAGLKHKETIKEKKMAQVDYFLKIDGIKGESHVDGHKDEIQLESWSWGESNSGTFASGGGGGAGKVHMQDFHFVMHYNVSSPKLFLACATGQHIAKANLTCRKAGGKQNPYLKVEFTDVLVSSYQSGGSAHGDILPTDQISLNFAKIKIEYDLQDEKGATQNAGNAGYDLKSETAF